MCYDGYTIESKFLQGWVKHPTGGKQSCKPASTKVQIRLNSGADSTVWMKEEQTILRLAGKGSPRGTRDWIRKP